MEHPNLRDPLLRTEEHLDCGPLVHGLVASGCLAERQFEIEDLARVDGAVPDQVDQLRQEPAHRRRATVEMHLGENSSCVGYSAYPEEPLSGWRKMQPDTASRRVIAVRTLAANDEQIEGGHDLAGFTVDEAGFDAFYQATARTLFRQLYAMCGNVEEARDCLQEGYMRAWQGWSRLASYDNPAAWVRAAAWRVAVSRWRHARRSLRHSRSATAPMDELEQIPEMLALFSALGRLPRLQREAVILHHLADLSLEEIADQLHSPIGTIKARLSRGRAALAGHLVDQESR